MNEQSQSNQPLEDHLEETIPPAPSEQPSQAPPARKFKLPRDFIVGFLGWYLATALLYGPVRQVEALMLCVGLLFPINVVVLILLLKKRPQAGWGMLTALGVNLAFSLILGLATSAICFVPFFYGVK